MIQTHFFKNNKLTFKVFIACLLMFIALIIPAFIIQNYPIFDNPNYNHIIKAISVGMIVIVGIWFLRSRLDRGVPKKIGLNKPRTAFKNIFLGIGLILVPLILALSLSLMFGWVKFSFNANNAIILSLFLGLISTLFTDALSEELIFRGYIFSNLKEYYGIWTSSIITVAIFVVAPILLITLQSSLNIHGAVGLSAGYVINLILFGSFMQYLRIIFKSIWVGVGFHLVFVHMNQLMGTSSDKLLQFSLDSNQQPIQITLIILLIFMFISLIIYPIIKRKRSLEPKVL